MKSVKRLWSCVNPKPADHIQAGWPGMVAACHRLFPGQSRCSPRGAGDGVYQKQISWMLAGLVKAGLPDSGTFHPSVAPTR
jgi:hypothetical protein